MTLRALRCSGLPFNGIPRRMPAMAGPTPSPTPGCVPTGRFTPDQSWWSSVVLGLRSLHEPLQPGQRRDLAQALAGRQRPRFELPDALTAQLRTVGEPGLGEHVQVLRDRLSGDAPRVRRAMDAGPSA